MIQGYTLTTFPNIVQYIYAQPEKKQAKELCRISVGGIQGQSLGLTMTPASMYQLKPPF